MTQIEYVLVPKEPTEAMRQVLADYWIRGSDDYTEIDAYRAMIAAAPPAALPPTGDVGELGAWLQFHGQHDPAFDDDAPQNIAAKRQREAADALTSQAARLAEVAEAKLSVERHCHSLGDHNQALSARLRKLEKERDDANDNLAEWDRRLTAATAHTERLEAALREARSIVEKWCHYQGNAPELFAQYLGPIDAALSAAPSKGGDEE
jgi:hypothetical protein